MYPTLALREKAMQLLAADAATLAPAADANVIALLMADPSPGEDITFGELTLATFDGSTPIAVGVGTQPEALDPANKDSIVDMKPPTTGFRWETTGTTHLPQTIYGYALLNNAQDTVFAVERLTTPITLTGVNQRVDIGAPNIRQQANSMS